MLRVTMTETLVQKFAILIDFKVPAAKATGSSTIIAHLTHAGGSLGRFSSKKTHETWKQKRDMGLNIGCTPGNGNLIGNMMIKL